MGFHPTKAPPAELPTAEGSPPVSVDHDLELIRRHLDLSPMERLEALQAFVDDVLKLRRGRTAQIR